MEGKIKKMIVLLLIIIAICLIILLIFTKRNNISPADADYSKDSEGIGDYIQIQEDNTVKNEKNKNVYYTVVSIVDEYINMAGMNDKTTLLNMLDLEYITNNNITEGNIIEKIGISSLNDDFQYYVFVPDTMYSVDEGKITTHFVYGNYYNIADMNKKELNLMVVLDTVNQTFNVYDYKYIVDKGYDKLKVGDSYNANIDKIENREDNTFAYISMSDEEMAIKYLENFKEIVLYDRNKTFEMLNNQYSDLKFKNKEDFNTFAENKKIEFFTAELKEYSVKINALGNKVYICRDQNDNYYYFQETDGIMKYEIVLDNYVLANEDFENKYLSASENIKVALNIDRFIQAINDKSYYYAYNCLADSYKNNHFKTLEEFENYAEKTFYGSTVGYNEFNVENELYTYSVVLTNKESGEQINKTFIMQLGQGTEFVLSFDK